MEYIVSRKWRLNVQAQKLLFRKSCTTHDVHSNGDIVVFGSETTADDQLLESFSRTIKLTK